MVFAAAAGLLRLYIFGRQSLAFIQLKDDCFFVCAHLSGALDAAMVFKDKGKGRLRSCREARPENFW